MAFQPRVRLSPTIVNSEYAVPNTKSDKLFISALIYVFHIVVRFLFIHRKLEGNELVLVTRSMREFFNRIDESERIVRNTVENCIRLNFESS